MSDLIERLNGLCERHKGMTPGPLEVVEHSWSDTGIYRGGGRIAALSILNEATEETQDELEARQRADARAFIDVPTMLAAIREAAAELVRLRADGGRYRAALLAAKRNHYECDDCWFSCPKSGECCNEAEGSECNCGADRHNAAIDAALEAIKEAGNG